MKSCSRVSLTSAQEIPQGQNNQADLPHPDTTETLETNVYGSGQHLAQPTRTPIKATLIKTEDMTAC